MFSNTRTLTLRISPPAAARSLAQGLGALALLAGAPTWAQPSSCEPLRAQIEAKIRGNGVADAVVRIADAAASAPGRVVGNCDGGRSLLRYTRGGPAAKASAPAHDGIPTECKDGRIVMGPDCSLGRR